MSSPPLSKEKETREWAVQARCVVLKEFIVRGTREQAEALTGEIIDERELDQMDHEVRRVEAND